MGMLRKNSLAELSGRLGKTSSLLIWAGLVVILVLVQKIVLLWSEQSRTPQISAIIVLLFLISNPWVVGFIYTFISAEKQELALKDGALRGAFAVLVLSCAGIIMSIIVFPDYALLGDVWDFVSVFGAVLQGAIAGIVATLWKNKDREKRIEAETENSASQNGENEQGKRLDVVGLVKRNANDFVFYSAYIFILLGAATTLGVPVYYGYWDILINPWLLLYLLAPSVLALMISTFLWKLFYNSRLSMIAALLASLVFFIVSAWVLFSSFPLKGGMFSGLWLLGIVWIAAGYILTLIVVFGLVWTIRFVNPDPGSIS